MVTGKSDIIEIAAEIKRETENAYHIDDGTTQAWIPKSQCEWNQSEGTFSMPEWIAKDKGLI